MRIFLASDLHQEFLGYTWEIPPDVNCDLVVLAGDIGNGIHTYEYAIRESEKLQVPVVIVLGNHELYKEDFTLYERAKEYTKRTDVHVLEKDVFEYQGYRFLGTTLWTDFLLYGKTHQKLAMKSCQDFMNDYRLITYNEHVLTPEDTLQIHQDSLEWLNKELQTTGKNIVVTHHGPTFYASHPKYRGDLLTPGFCSDLEGFILERKPLAWFSGHSHYCYNKQIGDTFCAANTKGYRGEGVEDFDPARVIEI